MKLKVKGVSFPNFNDVPMCVYVLPILKCVFPTFVVPLMQLFLKYGREEDDEISTNQQRQNCKINEKGEFFCKTVCCCVKQQQYR